MNAKYLCERFDNYYESLAIKQLGITGNTFFLDINGHKYGYNALSGNVKDIETKFRKIAKFSAGKALAWLKKNSKLVFGGK